MNTSETLHFSDKFVVSCGTVTLDLKESRVLVLHLRDISEYLFPKGRVNIGEDWRHAALRETFEETGVPVQPLPTAAVTKATHSTEDTSETPLVHTEPFAMTRRFDTEGVEKTIFWFAGIADSSIASVKSAIQPGEEHFDTRWLSYQDGLSLLTFANEQAMLRKLLSIVDASLDA